VKKSLASAKSPSLSAKVNISVGNEFSVIESKELLGFCSDLDFDEL
jgi:hypothetical protein